MRGAVGFRLRLGLFFVATLVTVQLVTAALVYGVTRRAMVSEGERQLGINAQAFVAQMDDISARVAGNVEVLSLDYALRSAIAERDHGTVFSVLRNHGRRVGASRMQLIGLDGKVEVDTADVRASGQRFAFPDLAGHAFERRAAAVVALQGRAYWVVVVPIYAPQPVGLVVVYVPLDDVLLAHLRTLSALPGDIELAVRPPGSPWVTVAQSLTHTGLVASLAGQGLPARPAIRRIHGHEYLLLAQPLSQPRSTAPVVAVLGYSLEDALRPFRAVVLAWAALLGLGLVVGLIGAWLTARSVSRPVEALAGAARRIEAGDYRAPPSLNRRDELGQLAAAFGTMVDAVRQREEHIRQQALHDQVTDLPNRVAAEVAIDRAREAGARHGALLMVGLTRAPDIIKTMGHGLYDRLMREVGARLGRVAAKAFLARATDTQFVAWLPGADRTEAVAAALRVLDALNTPYAEADVSVDTLPAIGIAMYPEDGALASVLLRHGEVAQFAATGSTRPLAFYDAATDPHRTERLSLMGELREALDHDRLMLHYQPKLALPGRRVDGVEALVRWHHPRRGAVPPQDFIGMAEDTGNIQRLTRWALAAGIAQASRWHAAGLDLNVAVNLSARDLGEAELPLRIGRLLSIHALPPGKLTVEITERAVIGEPETALRVLKGLADLGIGIAVDDFGVGQSAFAYLRHLPVSELKIDQTFVRHLARDASDQTIVQSIVELGHRLGYQVTAEGVEDEGTLAQLAAIGCDHAQGFFIARPLPATELAGFASDRAGAA
ncbi:putative bifunctional diguanylate cyclase/phosphodiesterase [Frateuria hangzhouensis]|uniref:putative bifunctional diguanylate cyclase/phosphodiesterase n=1 Tax=Frateuria hangzhouensis TaxID=2995589 RepID=UPI002260CDAD|nr:EAL domain-containing protein [Frateuria sp. STR12]MCX7512217.1 EAL domain-containing protein [Frateuria sp. STR12]